jgi:hypothetical protein
VDLAFAVRPGAELERGAPTAVLAADGGLDDDEGGVAQHALAAGDDLLLDAVDVELDR